MTYTFDNRTDPPTCYPSDLDINAMQDITVPGDKLRVLLDRTTGVIHYGERYAAEMRKLIDASGVRHG